MARYSIKSVSLSRPHFKWATTRMRLRASLHCVFSTLMCFLNERCESHHSPRNFVDSSTGRSVFPILTMGGLWARDRGAVKCMTLHLWAANLKPFLVAHSSMAFTACCRCLWCPESVPENLGKIYTSDISMINIFHLLINVIQHVSVCIVAHIYPCKTRLIDRFPSGQKGNKRCISLALILHVEIVWTFKGS